MQPEPGLSFHRKAGRGVGGTVPDLQRPDSRRHKTHITENMKGYFYDYEDKENAEYPEFMLPGGFRDNILVVKDFVIQKIEKLPYTGTKGYFGNGLDGYSVEVQFTIYDESKEKGEYVKNLGYWVALANNKFYIYADDTLNDIYILEKDLEN